MGKHKAGYLYSNVMSFALKMYRNQRSLGEWKTKNILTKKKIKEDIKYLALLTQIQVMANSVVKVDPMKSNGRDGKRNCTLKWCTDNCHAHFMWCNQNNCLPCKEYQKKRKEEGKGGTENEQKKKDNFKVALSALLSDNDFKSINEQFLN
eukprot:6866265-Ditylum_brightwellii.AAC.1